MIAAGAKVTRHHEQHVPYLVTNDGQWYSYDDEQSIREKVGVWSPTY
jgi:hypothetical protein